MLLKAYLTNRIKQYYAAGLGEEQAEPESLSAINNVLFGSEAAANDETVKRR